MDLDPFWPISEPGHGFGPMAWSERPGFGSQTQVLKLDHQFLSIENSYNITSQKVVKNDVQTFERLCISSF